MAQQSKGRECQGLSRFSRLLSGVKGKIRKSAVFGDGFTNAFGHFLGRCAVIEMPDKLAVPIHQIHKGRMIHQIGIGVFRLAFGDRFGEIHPKLSGRLGGLFDRPGQTTMRS